jgi:hypothetical protein
MVVEFRWKFCDEISFIKINDFGEKDCVTNCVRVYYKLLTDYMVKLGTPSAVHVVKNFFPMRFAR